MKRNIMLIAILCVLTGIAGVTAAEPFAFQWSAEGTGWVPSPDHTPMPYVGAASADSTTITMFYSHTCSECQNVLTGFLPQFLVEHPEVKVQYYDTADNATNKALFASYNAHYNRPGSSVPAIFVGDRELVGYEEITAGLEGALRESNAHIDSGDVSADPDNETTIPTASFGSFTDQFLGATSFGQPSTGPVPAWTPLPNRIQDPSNDEPGLDSANYTPYNSPGFFNFVVPAVSDLTPASLQPEDAGRNTAFTIPFAFPGYAPPSPDDSEPSPSASTGIKLSDGSLLTPFGIPDTKVVIPTSGCEACG